MHSSLNLLSQSCSLLYVFLVQSMRKVNSNPCVIICCYLSNVSSCFLVLSLCFCCSLSTRSHNIWLCFSPALAMLWGEWHSSVLVDIDSNWHSENPIVMKQIVCFCIIFWISVIVASQWYTTSIQLSVLSSMHNSLLELELCLSDPQKYFPKYRKYLFTILLCLLLPVIKRLLQFIESFLSQYSHFDPFFSTKWNVKIAFSLSWHAMLTRQVGVRVDVSFFVAVVSVLLHSL